MAVCIWSVRHDRPFELELFCAVNILQFVFLALKLDRCCEADFTLTVLWLTFWLLTCAPFKQTATHQLSPIGRSPDVKLHLISPLRLIVWPWEICFVPLWIVLCISLVGVLYTIIFAGILLRMPEVNAEQRRTSTNSALGGYTGHTSAVCLPEARG